MQAAELQVLKNEYKRALQEPPWDGMCTATTSAAPPIPRVSVARK